MNVDPANPEMGGQGPFRALKGTRSTRDFTLHSQRKDIFQRRTLKTLRHTGSYLQGHPDMKHIPGIDMSSGSLGQGVSVAVGMAAAGQI